MKPSENVLKQLEAPDPREVFIIETLKETQKGNTVNPSVTMPELDMRCLLAQKFQLSSNWAWDLIRLFCKKNPHLHLEKEDIISSDGPHPLYVMKYLES